MAWTTITGANTGSIPQGVLKTEIVLDAPVMDFVSGMNAGFGETITSQTLENQSFNPVVMKEQYDAGVAAGGGGGSVRPASGLVFPRGT
jgi:hypothetical protein